jgi:hypothetical protein
VFKVEEPVLQLELMIEESLLEKFCNVYFISKPYEVNLFTFSLRLACQDSSTLWEIGITWWFFQ